MDNFYSDKLNNILSLDLLVSISEICIDSTLPPLHENDEASWWIDEYIRSKNNSLKVKLLKTN